MEALKEGVNPTLQKKAARAAKKASLPQRISTVAPRNMVNKKHQAGGKNAKRALGRGFASELTDTSRKSAGPRFKPKSRKFNKAGRR